MSTLAAEFLRLHAGLPLAGLEWRGEGLQAAVLVALTDEPEPQVLLGRRSRSLRLHPGEIAFPGGKRELEDRTPWDTAKRETMEEVGIAAELVHPLGELEPLITRSGFEVHPCIARVPAALELVVDASEFDGVFHTELAVFADRRLFRLERMQVEGREKMVPHYQIGNDNIWGVTAAVLAQLANLAYDAELDLQRDWNQKP